MTRKTYATFIRLFTAMTLAWNPLAFAARVGDSVPGGHRSPEGNSVHYQGQTDALGRERVYSVTNENGNPSFRNGTLEANGTITWDGLPGSRRPGQRPTFPNYPEIKGGKNPLPPGRSLVPVGPLRTHDVLPEFSEAGRPSALRQHINNTRDWARTQKAAIARAKNAFTNSQGLNELARSSSNLLTKIQGSGGTMLGYGAGFFVAMGFVSAYLLMTQYPENPAAWSAYLDSTFSYVGAASFAGFLAGAWAFLKIVGPPSPDGKTLSLVGRFSGVLLAGSLVSTPISIIGNKPDFQACYGFTAYQQTGKFTRDLAACDRLYSWMQSDPAETGMVNEIANVYVPYAASLLAAGGVYLGIYSSAIFVINKTGVYNWLRSMALNKENVRGGGLIGTAAVIVLHMSLFMLAQTISNSLFDVEKKVREFLVATKGLFGHFYGDSISAAEYNLLIEWKRLKTSGWKDPGSWDRVCYDEKRSYQHFYNCDAPDQLDVPGLLDRYASLQASWRGIQMQETVAAYQQWVLKVGNFNSLAGASYVYYKAAVEQIRLTGRLDTQALEATLKESWPQIASTAPPQEWSKLDLHKMSDFLLASMACGPELEGYAGTSWWDSTRQNMKSLIGRTGPAKTIDNTDGFTAKFYPPRITTPLDGTTATVCERSVSWLPQLMSTPVELFQSESRGQVVTGLSRYVEQNLRASVTNTDDAFEQWWSARVMSGADQLMKDMRKEYREMLEKVFKPALVRNDYRWCEPGRVTGTGLEKSLSALTTPYDKCGGDAVSRLNYGLLANLKDEIRLYLAMAIDLYVSNLRTIGGQVKLAEPAVIEKHLNDLSRDLILRYDRYLNYLTVADPAQRRDLEQVEIWTSEPYIELETMILNAEARDDKPALPAFQLVYAKKLLEKTLENLKSAKTLFNILTAMDDPAENYSN